MKRQWNGSQDVGCFYLAYCVGRYVSNSPLFHHDHWRYNLKFNIRFDYISGSMAVYVKTICGYQSGIIRCPPRRVIAIHSVLYGRLNPKTCPHPQIKSINCRSSLAPLVVRGKCQGQNSCYVYSSHHFYGDPCFGTYKYLEIAYWCNKRG